jgi:SRSO17 transposase
VPDGREFQTKLELGWQMIQRVHAEGFPFAAIACDCHYGRSAWLRDQMVAAGLEYYADVPADTKVYLQPPVIGIPQTSGGRKPKSGVSSHHPPCALIACGST